MRADKPDRSPTPEELESVAAGWLGRLDAGLTLDERAEFEAWMAADPRHAAAWTEVTAAWMIFDRPRRLGQADDMVLELAHRRHRRRARRYALGAAGLAATATVLLCIWLREGRRPAAADLVLARPERRVLVDGSVLELNKGAQVSVDYRPGQRDVRLIRGEVIFAVAKNAARPFVVAAGTVKVRAVGTEFAVELEPQAVDVVVTEGRVAVDCGPAAGESGPVSRPVMVAAGSRLVVPEASGPLPQAEALPAPEIEQLLAWRGPRLELSGTSLAQTIIWFNRENRVQLSIADPALAQMRMSGIFRADNAEGFVRLLENNYGVRAERRGQDVIVLYKAP